MTTVAPDQAENKRDTARARLEAFTISECSSREDLKAVIMDVAMVVSPTSAAEQLTLSRLAGEAFALAGHGEIADEADTEPDEDEPDAPDVSRAFLDRAEAAEAARAGVTVEARRAALARDEAVRVHLVARAVRAARRSAQFAPLPELRQILQLVRARVPMSASARVRLPATGSLVREIAALDPIKHAGQVEGDLRRYGRDLAARGVEQWRSVALVMDAWRVRLLGGSERAEAWASAILGRDVYIATFRYPRMIEDDGDSEGDLAIALAKAAAAAGSSLRADIKAGEPRPPVFTYRMENPDPEDEYGGEDPREDLKRALVLGDVLITYGNALAGGARSLDSKELGARHELTHVRERYLDRLNGVDLLPRAAQASVRRYRHTLRRGVIAAVSDFAIEGEVLLEREVGRPVNASAATPDEVRGLAQTVLRQHRFKERAAAVCGVARPTFTRWLAEDPAKYRAPDDQQLAALRDAARAA